MTKKTLTFVPGVMLGFVVGMLFIIALSWCLDTQSPEPTQTVIEFGLEDVADSTANEDSLGLSDNVLVILPAPIENRLTFTFPANTEGYYGDVMEVKGTGDLEIECGTLKFKDGKLVAIRDCSKVVMFTITDVWP